MHMCISSIKTIQCAVLAICFSHRAYPYYKQCFSTMSIRISIVIFVIFFYHTWKANSIIIKFIPALCHLYVIPSIRPTNQCFLHPKTEQMHPLIILFHHWETYHRTKYQNLTTVFHCPLPHLYLQRENKQFISYITNKISVFAFDKTIWYTTKKRLSALYINPTTWMDNAHSLNRSLKP